MRIGVLASVGHMVDSFFSDIITSWRTAGHEVSVAAGTGTRDGAERIIPGLTRRPGPGVARAWSGLRSWAQEEQLDVILTNTATASAVARTARLQIPVVYFCHGLHWNKGRAASDRLWQVVERLLLRHTAGVITINSDDHAWFDRRLRADRILRLPTGVGLSPDTYPRVPPPGAEGDPAESTLRLAWIGEFSTRKRPHLALEVAASLRQAGVKFALQMVGEGALWGPTNEAIRRRGLANDVTAAGSADAAAVLAASHALIHTSAWEGLPRVMLEALAVGRPTYAFDVKGVRDVPQARLFPEDQPSLLARHVADDWQAGRLLKPLSIDPNTLDFSHCADAVSSFLEATSSNLPRGTTAAGAPVPYETT